MVAIAATTLALTAVPAHATFPGTNGKIAFAGNQDGDYEIYTVDPDGSDLQQLTHNSVDDRDPAWSADGRYLAFIQDGAVYAMDQTGANQTEISNSGRDPQWSPNGDAIAFVTALKTIFQVNAAGGYDVIYTGSASQWIYDLDWWAGHRIAFSRAEGSGGADLYLVVSTGAGSSASQLTSAPGSEVNISFAPTTSELRFAYARQAGSGNDGIWRTAFPPQVTNNPDDDHPAWSPDGAKFAVSGEVSGADIDVMNVDGSNRTPVIDSPNTTELEPDWQPAPAQAPPSYVRPKAATPLEVSLVPAYRPCDEPDGEHGPPLAFASCNPPAQESDYLTVGTADSNGQPTKFLGSARLVTVRGNPATPNTDEADVSVQANLVDVRCKPAQVDPCASNALADYIGDVQLAMDVRLTDRRVNHFGQAEQLTMTDIYRLPFAFSCTATADTTVGGTCALSTSMEALYPGSIKENARTMWELGQIEVRDGGLDGSAASDDYTVFAKQGVFVP